MSATWVYPSCTVVEVHDGDTITVDMDLGQQIWVKSRPIRLVGIAARELKDPGGPEARDYLRTLLPIGTVVKVMSVGWDKYAPRIDGWVSLSNGVIIQDLMVQNGYAVAWNGTGIQPKAPWPIP